MDEGATVRWTGGTATSRWTAPPTLARESRSSARAPAGFRLHAGSAPGCAGQPRPRPRGCTPGRRRSRRRPPRRCSCAFAPLRSRADVAAGRQGEQRRSRRPAPRVVVFVASSVLSPKFADKNGGCRRWHSPGTLPLFTSRAAKSDVLRHSSTPELELLGRNALPRPVGFPSEQGLPRVR